MVKNSVKSYENRCINRFRESCLLWGLSRFTLVMIVCNLQKYRSSPTNDTTARLFRISCSISSHFSFMSQFAEIPPHSSTEDTIPRLFQISCSIFSHCFPLHFAEIPQQLDGGHNAYFASAGDTRLLPCHFAPWRKRYGKVPRQRPVCALIYLISKFWYIYGQATQYDWFVLARWLSNTYIRARHPIETLEHAMYWRSIGPWATFILWNLFSLVVRTSENDDYLFFYGTLVLTTWLLAVTSMMCVFIWRTRERVCLLKPIWCAQTCSTENLAQVRWISDWPFERH